MNREGGLGVERAEQNGGPSCGPTVTGEDRVSQNGGSSGGLAGLIGCARLPIVADLVEQLRAVVSPDQLAEVIEQLDDGESLLGVSSRRERRRALSGASGSRAFS